MSIIEALKYFTDCPDWRIFLHDMDCTDSDHEGVHPDDITCTCDGPYRISVVEKAIDVVEKAIDEQVTVIIWAVEGDFGNVGSGRTLGIFATESEALDNAKGCGSLDCGGNGIVRKRTAVIMDGAYYLLQDERHPLKLGEMGWSGAIDNHSNKNCKLALVVSKSMIPTIRVLRGKLNLSLQESKCIVDNLPHIFDLSYFGRHELKSALEDIGDIVEELLDAED